MNKIQITEFITLSEVEGHHTPSARGTFRS